MNARRRSGGGFPNRCSEFESEFGLILQDLHRQYSPRGHIFASYRAPKAYQANPENCAKLLKANAGVFMDGALADRTSPGDLPLPHFEFEA
jgi:hypothetical protein